jgi:TRAP-type C4-dicarboxylate transport system substrate-binding protein
MDKADRLERQKMLKAGITFYDLSADELASWVKAAAPMDQAWVEKVTKLGVISKQDAEKLLQDVRAEGAACTSKLSH